MKISDLKQLLSDKRVTEEINRHLWIESQKAGYSIGVERATEEWLRLYAEGWMKYHMPEQYQSMQERSRKEQQRRTVKVKSVVAHKKHAKIPKRK